jgi:hypothetical protein
MSYAMVAWWQRELLWWRTHVDLQALRATTN